MISVGIDVAKGKSTVCILKPYGEIVSKPFDIAHNEKEKKYHQSQAKAKAIYKLAHESIPTLSSETPSVKMLVTEAVRVLKEVDATLGIILSRMQELAKGLPEYAVVREMGGVGEVLAPKLIAEVS